MSPEDAFETSGVPLCNGGVNDGGDKAIAPLGHRLQKAGLLGIIFKHAADLTHRKVETLLEVHQRSGSPRLFQPAPGA